MQGSIFWAYRAMLAPSQIISSLYNLYKHTQLEVKSKESQAQTELIIMSKPDAVKS